MIEFLFEPYNPPTILPIIAHCFFWLALLVAFENRKKIKVLTESLKDTRYRLDELKADFSTIGCCEQQNTSIDFEIPHDKKGR